jgi:hypothetical protein
LGIEIWNFDDSVAVSAIILTNLDRSIFGKKVARAQLRRKADQVAARRTPAEGAPVFPVFERFDDAFQVVRRHAKRPPRLWPARDHAIDLWSPSQVLSPCVFTTLGVVALDDAAAPSIGLGVGDRIMEDRSIVGLAMKLRTSDERRTGFDREPVVRRQPSRGIFKPSAFPRTLALKRDCPFLMSTYYGRHDKLEGLWG